MGFTAYTRPAASIDALPVFDVSETIPAAGALPTVTIPAAELDGATALMFVHDSPVAANDGRLRVFAEADAATGVLAEESQWGEYPGAVADSLNPWRLPVVLPAYGGDVRLTLSNPSAAAAKDVIMRGYALRGVDLTPRAVTRGLFFPDAPVSAAATRTLHIPTIPPQYRTAFVRSHATGDTTPNQTVSMVWSISGDLAGGSAGDAFVTTGTVVLGTMAAEGDVVESVVEVAGLESLKIQITNGDDLNAPNRFGVTVALRP